VRHRSGLSAALRPADAGARDLQDLDDPTAREALLAELQALLDQVNATLEDHERLTHVVVVQDPWSIDNGFLTPTMKIKRRVIEERYLSKATAWAGSDARSSSSRRAQSRAAPKAVDVEADPEQGVGHDVIHVAVPASPRKRPRQGRSIALVDALKKAGWDILERNGARRCRLAALRALGRGRQLDLRILSRPWSR
jgi:hypothetical protein